MKAITILLPRFALLNTVVAVISAVFASSALTQQTSPASDLYYYQQGRVPIIVALVDSVPYPSADAVIIRRRAQVPHDVIVIRSAAASETLLVRAFFTLYTAHFQDSACPSRDAVHRVTERSGTAPPDWSDNDRRGVATLLERLRTRSNAHVSGIGSARAKKVWIRRFWNEPRERYPFGQGGPTSVC